MGADRSRQLLAPSTSAALEFAARSHPTTGPGQAGGDLHEALLTPAGPRLLIGDVKGHGPAAALLAALVLDTARPTAETEPDPVRLAAAFDARLSPHLAAEDFVTLLIGDFHPLEVRLTNCGHPPPLRVTRRGLAPLTPRSFSPPLGLGPTPRIQRFGLSLDQRLLLYTDGLTEARAADGTFFPVDSRRRHRTRQGAAHRLPGPRERIARTREQIVAYGLPAAEGKQNAPRRPGFARTHGFDIDRPVQCSGRAKLLEPAGLQRLVLDAIIPYADRRTLAAVLAESGGGSVSRPTSSAVGTGLNSCVSQGPDEVACGAGRRAAAVLGRPGAAGALSPMA